MKSAIVATINKKLLRTNVKKNVTYHENAISLIKPATKNVGCLQFKVTSTNPCVLCIFPDDLKDFWNETSLVSDALVAAMSAA